MKTQKVTIHTLQQKKQRGEKIAMLTAYDATFARIFDEAGIDVLLVGDSVGNTVQVGETTLPVTLDEMLYHTRLVARTARRALVVGDMPFGSYQVSPEDGVRSAIRFVKEAGAAALKLEGGRRVRDTIARIVDAEIPVMGHVGLTPQSLHRMGGYRVQGRGAAREAVIEDALAVQEVIVPDGATNIRLEAKPLASLRNTRVFNSLSLTSGQSHCFHLKGTVNSPRYERVGCGS